MRKRDFIKILAPLFFASIIGNLKAIAYTVSITGDFDSIKVEAGHIISQKDTGYNLSDSSYSTDVVGVITDTPEIAIFEKGAPNPRYIAITGNSMVKVSNVNGNISPGDYLTSSEIPGVGMKATESGRMIGKAIDPFESENESDQGMIRVNLEIKDVIIAPERTRNLFELLRKGVLSPVLYPVESLRYLIAGSLIVISFSLGIYSYIRISINSVQAIGRNPIAKDDIKNATRKSFKMASIVIVAGLVISYIILAI